MHWSHTREPSSSHAAVSTFKVCTRKWSLLTLCITCLTFRPIKMEIPWYNSRHTLLSRKRGGKPRMIRGQFVVVRVRVHQLNVSPNISHPMLQICSKLLHGNSTPSLNSSYIQLTPTQSLKSGQQAVPEKRSLKSGQQAVPEKRSAIELSSRHLNEAVN
jgi:hypothetical protein